MSKTHFAFALSALLTALSATPFTDSSKARADLRLLYVTQSMGFRHAVLHESESIMESLGAQHGFRVTHTQRAQDYLTPQRLPDFDVIVFYTTGELPLDEVQKRAFLDWIKAGKGFIGLHSATDTFYQWPEYGELIGGWFNKHPWTAKDTVTIRTVDKNFPVTAHWEDSFELTEEIYQIKDFNENKVTVTMKLDTAKSDMTKPGIVAKEFPLAWYRDYGRGKVFYCALGHNPEVWRDRRYQTMVVNAVKWVSGQLQ